jgi:flagellar hook assembly protein FlgD
VRRIAASLVALVVLAGYAVPAASAAAPPQPKVVIIVGPVASSTAAYKADGDAAYAEARKYTANVFKVYAPNATWAAAKKALQGASVVIYMGHGNGFPSPYRSSPWPYSQNGLGLNPKAGGDNSTTKYYGEYYLARDVDLAPNAIVLLNHLCYASGNSESGKPKPTLSQARQRVDNMAAGWLRTGARAVVAEAHFGPAWYVRQLFTTHKTVGQIFADSPTFNDNAFTFPSSRTAGATAEMDPDGTPGGYWRSATGWLDTRTDDITGATYADTGVDPTDFVVPGAASVGVDEAGVFADETLTPDPGSGLPPASLPRDTRLRLLARSHLATAAGDPVFEVATLDGATSGWMSGADLVPRDSASPVVWTVDDGNGAFSPNGDGSGDTYRLTGRTSETADWTVAFEDDHGDELASRSGTGGAFAATWDGIVGGAPVADGTYGWLVTVRDGWGNPTGTRRGTFRVDTVAPSFNDAVVAAGADTPTFSPNGDGDADTIAFPFSIDEAGYVDASVRDATGALVRSFTTRVAVGPGRVAWDGLDDAGHVVHNGVYTVRLAPRDLAGNVGPYRETPAAVYKTLSHVAGSKAVFFPQDLDKYAKTTRFSFDLSVSATVDGTVIDGAGNVVLTMFDGAPLGAGTHVFDWDGRLADGTMAPRGTYTAVIRATDGELATSGRTSVVADGFKIRLNDTTPGRGQTITLYATSPELLSSLPRVKVSQSGASPFSVTMTKMSSTTYKVTIRLKSTGSAGTVRFSLSGTDAGGRINRASRTFVLH